MIKEKPALGDSKPAELIVWDTHYCSANKGFTFFREGVCSTFMPWAPEKKSDQGFEGRIESRIFENGSAAHVIMTPITATRAGSHVADSCVDGLYGNYVVQGECIVEQAGRTTVAKRGDLVIYHTSEPVTLTEKSDALYEDVAFLFPKRCFSLNEKGEARLRNLVLSQSQMMRPLSSSLAYLAHNMATETPEVLSAVFDACVALLPVAGGCIEAEIQDPDSHPTNHMLREIMEFVHQNISDAELCPQKAAAYCGISSRYVHKLFAASNTTFSAYILAKRLEHIRNDLLAPVCRSQPISTLAFRWGFNDLSSFNRAFKSRFGCSPSRFRAQYTR
jgi:AraC-like DNA-binding protein